jgi:hypothetical protein
MRSTFGQRPDRRGRATTRRCESDTTVKAGRQLGTSWVHAAGPGPMTPGDRGGYLDPRYGRRRGRTTRPGPDGGGEEGLMLAKLIRGRSWPRRDPGIWRDSDRSESSTKTVELADPPSNGGGIVSAPGDALTPVLLLRFHP